jgi:NADPH-dependent 7-cyano-7-deazaguanine reductase QueF
VFGKTLDPNTVKLLQALDKTIEAHAKVEKNAAKQMAGMFVLMTDNPDAGEAKIKRLQRKLKLKHLPLTVFDGTNGPAGYHINKDAAVTVSMWQKSEVKLNQSFRQTKDIKDETVTSVLKATKKILPPGQVKKDA